MDETYEIIDGVRRAKAAQMSGHQTILAKLYAIGASKLIREFEVSIHQLRSPHKSSIRRVSPADRTRWNRVVSGAKQNPLPFPPIEIVTGSRGAKIEDISFELGDNP